MLDEAKVLSDALGLEDFGLLGLVRHAIQLTRDGQGIDQLIAGSEKREQYGYWEARLKDGFHSDKVRAVARRRLEQARRAAAALRAEWEEDRNWTS